MKDTASWMQAQREGSQRRRGLGSPAAGLLFDDTDEGGQRKARRRLSWTCLGPTLLLALLLVLVPAVLVFSPPAVEVAATEARPGGFDVGDGAIHAVPAGRAELQHEIMAAQEPLVAEEPTPADELSPSAVVVGVMTCARYLDTRGRMQSATWLSRMRRVIFFSEVDDEQAARLRTPLVVHGFAPAPTERIWAGGNWRALPILRSLAQLFFTDEAQQRLAARGEVAPEWAFMADDDSFAFDSQLLSTLKRRAQRGPNSHALDARAAAVDREIGRSHPAAGSASSVSHLSSRHRYDPDEPHYLGYAFIAAPHLEGIIKGKRQPLFANGGAGIAVSRAAMKRVLPFFARCEAEYRWNWPGDVRVAQARARSHSCATMDVTATRVTPFTAPLPRAVPEGRWRRGGVAALVPRREPAGDHPTGSPDRITRPSRHATPCTRLAICLTPRFPASARVR